MVYAMGRVEILAATSMLLAGAMAAGTGLVDVARLTPKNKLGLMAQACATYCSPGVTGLDLWESFSQVHNK